MRQVGYAVDTAVLEETVALLAASLGRHRGELNRLNVYPVPDGDTGDNLVATLASVTDHLDGARTRAEVVSAIGLGALLGGRGSSGVITGQALRAFVDSLSAESPGAGAGAGVAVAHALTEAATAARAAVADPVEGTILTVADDAARASSAVAAAGGSVTDGVMVASAEGRQSLLRTPELLPALARAGVVDAGGLGWVLFLDALAEAVTGTSPPPLVLGAPLLERPPTTHEAATPGTATPETGTAEVDRSGRYEVLCLLEASREGAESLRAAWSGLGDTVAIAGAGHTWRAHVHTHDPMAALDAARATAEVGEVEITDLAEQVGERGLQRLGGAGATAGTGATTGTSETTGVSVVAVAEGDGLVASYLEAGAARVVLGGLTSKPSTGELVRVIDACAGPVLLLPGDRDVVPAAQRAAELARVPTRLGPADMLVGLLALERHGWPPDRDEPQPPSRRHRDAGLDAGLDAVASGVADAARGIRTVVVQRAVRDARTELGEVHEGEWLAMAPTGLVALGASASEALAAAADALVGDATRRGVVALDAQAPPGDVVATLQAAHPAVRWEVRRTNRPSCAYGLAVW